LLQAELSRVRSPEEARDFLFTKTHPDWPSGPPSPLSYGYWGYSQGCHGVALGNPVHPFRAKVSS